MKKYLLAFVAVALVGVGVAVGAQAADSPPPRHTYVTTPTVDLGILGAPGSRVQWKLDFVSQMMSNDEPLGEPTKKTLIPWNQDRVSFGASEGEPWDGYPYEELWEDHRYFLTIDIDGVASRHEFQPWWMDDEHTVLGLRYEAFLQGMSTDPAPVYKVSFIGGTLNASRDTSFVDSLKAAGYQVTRFDDSLVTAAQVNDTIVIISSSVDVAVMRPKVSQMDEPIVSWQPYVAFQMGLTTKLTDQGLQPAREAAAAWQAGTNPDYGDPYTMQVLAPTHPVVDHAIQNTPGVWTLSPSFGTQEWWSVIDERYLKAPATALARRVTHGGVNMATVVANESTRRILLPFTWQTQHKLEWMGWDLFADAVRWAAEGQ